MKAPEECKTIKDAREQIEQIDQEIIALISKRAQFVRLIPRLQTANSAPINMKELLEIRRQWASHNRLDPDQIESIFTSLIGYLNSPEMNIVSDEPTEKSIPPIDASSLI